MDEMRTAPARSTPGVVTVTLPMRPELHRRAKAAAALAGEPLAHWIHRLVAERIHPEAAHADPVGR